MTVITILAAIAVTVMLVAVVYGWLGVHTRRVRRLEERPRPVVRHPITGKQLKVFTAEELPDVVQYYQERVKHE